MMTETYPDINLTQNSSPELKNAARQFGDEQYYEAISAFKNCPEIKTDPEVNFQLGLSQKLCGEINEAISTWKQTLKLDATFAPALYYLAKTYSEMSDAPQAMALFTRLLMFHPEHLEGKFHFGILLYNIGRTEDAIHTFASLSCLPNPPHGVLVNLGRALRRAGRLEEADACYRRALIEAPNDAFLQWNRSHVLCLLGKWGAGFAAWEYRLQATVKLPFTPDLVEWKGGTLPNTLLIIGEQGHGDTIQCLRYIPYLLERGCQPTLVIHPALVSLTQKLFAALYHSVTFFIALCIRNFH